MVCTCPSMATCMHPYTVFPLCQFVQISSSNGSLANEILLQLNTWVESYRGNGMCISVVLHQEEGFESSGTLHVEPMHMPGPGHMFIYEYSRCNHRIPKKRPPDNEWWSSESPLSTLLVWTMYCVTATRFSNWYCKTFCEECEDNTGYKSNFGSYTYTPTQ